jgi:hypothetical protein
MSALVRGCAVLSVVAVLAACSTSDFKQPVTAFADATKLAAASLTEYEQTLDKAALDANITYAAAHPAELRAMSNECRLGAQRCRLVLRSRDGTTRPLDPGPVDPKIRAIMAAVVEYSNNLKAIATADKTAEIKTATDATKTNAINLAKAIDAYNAQQKVKADKLEPRVTELAGPLAEAAAFALNLYVESIKLKALRHATTVMDEVFPELMAIAGEVADAGMAVKRNQLGVAYVNADDTLWQKQQQQSQPQQPQPQQEQPKTQQPPVDRAKVVAVISAAQAYDSALNTKPKALFNALAEAHQKLTKALNKSDVTFEELWPLLQNVADQASKLAAIVQAIQKASETKK